MTSLAPTRPAPKSTPKARKPRPKPARSIRWLTSPISSKKPYGAIRITCGPLVTDYFLSEIGAAEGPGFELEKIDHAPTGQPTDRYHVNLLPDGRHTCDCLGHEHHGHCKHVEGLQALFQPRPIDRSAA
jgi:hypothetical protein